MNPETQTYSLPMGLMAFLVLLGVAALGYLYYRRRQLQLAVEERFKTFRAEAVALMDRLDAKQTKGSQADKGVTSRQAARKGSELFE